MALWTTYGIGWAGTDTAGLASGTGGIRELLQDGITNIAPQKTATYSMLPKESVASNEYSWLTDTLYATSTGGVIEGATFASADASASARSRLYNNVQYQRRSLYVSFQAVEESRKGHVGGVRNEYQYQLGLRLIELRRDMNARGVALGVGTVTRLTGAVATAPRTTVIRGFAAVATDVSGGFATGSYMALREAMDNEGAEPDALFCSTGVKLDISNLFRKPPGGGDVTDPSPFRVNQLPNDNRFRSVVSFLEDDLGEVFCVRDQFIPQASATATASGLAAAYFLLDRSKVRFCIWNGIRHIPLPPDGTVFRGIVEAWWGMKALHPSSIGIGWNVTT